MFHADGFQMCLIVNTHKCLKTRHESMSNMLHIGTEYTDGRVFIYFTIVCLKDEYVTCLKSITAGR